MDVRGVTLTLPLLVHVLCVSGLAMSPSQTASERHAPNWRRGGLDITWEVDVAEHIRQRRQQQQQQQQQIDSLESTSSTIIPSLRRRHHHRPFMVGLVGIPGSGKTTSAQILADLCGGNATTLCMPFDGYHYPLAHLQAMLPNPDDLVYRRGAPDTFDATLLLRDLHRIRDGDENTISLPGFDHAKGDPHFDQHIFQREQHHIVITEGLYLLHKVDGWSQIKECFDLTVYIDANVDACMERLKVRNLCIPGYTADEIVARVDAVDRVNAMTVAQSKNRADVVVPSVTS